MWLRRLSLRQIWLSGLIHAISIRKPHSRHERSYAAAAAVCLPLPAKPVVVKFDGGLLSSDGGVLALREVEQRLPGRRSARRLHDRSSRSRSDHAQLGGRHPFSTADDQRRLRGRQRRQCAAPRSSMFKTALDLFAHLIGSCARSRQYRGWRDLLPDVRAVLRMGRAMVDLYCGPSPRFPNGSRWTSTTRSMRSSVVSSVLRLFNAHYDGNTIFSRSSCSTAKAASSPPCFVLRQAGEQA